MEWEVNKLTRYVDLEETIQRHTLYSVDKMEPHHVRLVAQGEQFWFYLDGMLAGTWRDATLIWRSNWFGLYNEGGTFTIQVDNLKFWKLE
jgi:hypothetical protein